MIRAFLALPIPEGLAHVLTLAQHRLRLDRPVPPDALHLTLAFLGEQPEPVLEDLHAALERRSLPGAQLQVTGLGVFGGDQPRSLHAVVAAEPGLMALRRKVGAALREAGLPPPGQRFVPHVTLARFRPGEARAEALAAALQAHGPLTSAAHAVPELLLMRSTLRRDGAVHDPLASYALTL